MCDQIVLHMFWHNELKSIFHVNNVKWLVFSAQTAASKQQLKKKEVLV